MVKGTIFDFPAITRQLPFTFQRLLSLEHRQRSNVNVYFTFSVMPHYMYETCVFQVSKSLGHLVSGPATRQGHPSRSVTWRPVSSPENGPGEFELKSITPARFAGLPELHLT
jgi:hypothetical protein